VKPDPAAVNVIVVPLLNDAVQLVAQLVIPVGFELTVPVPTTVTVRTGRLKWAVTAVLAVRVKVQVPVPVQPAPVQPEKFETAFGVAVMSIVLPTEYLPQTPAGPPLALHDTDPPPPFAVAGVAVTEKVVGVRVNVAVTDESAVTVMLQSAVPVQLILPVPLLHPAKVDPLLATPRNVNCVPVEYDAAQGPKAPPVLH
jgi:hypothetical protein